jgi:hypothetical protein
MTRVQIRKRFLKIVARADEAISREHLALRPSGSAPTNERWRVSARRGAAALGSRRPRRTVAAPSAPFPQRQECVR